MKPDTVRKHYIEITGFKGRRHSKTAPVYLPATMQKLFNIMRRNGATPKQIAETLRMPLGQVHERIAYMKRMGDAR